MGSSNFGIPEFLLFGQILHDEAAFSAHYGSLVAENRPKKPPSNRNRICNSTRTLTPSSSFPSKGSAGKNMPRRASSNACASGICVSKVLFPIEEVPEELPVEPSTKIPEKVSEAAKVASHA